MKIKATKLQWQDRSNPIESGIKPLVYHIAYAPCAVYVVQSPQFFSEEKHKFDLYWSVGVMPQTKEFHQQNPCSSVEDGKKLCQQDWENLIEKCLQFPEDNLKIKIMDKFKEITDLVEPAIESSSDDSSCLVEMQRVNDFENLRDEMKEFLKQLP